MKKTIFALSVLLSTSAAAMPMLDITPMNGGAWVEFTQDGVPVENAVINADFVTNENGRVFVRDNLRQVSRTVDFIAVSPDGETIETRAFIPVSDR